MDEIKYKKENNQYISAFQREEVVTHMLGYLDEEKIDMNEGELFLVGYLDTPQWVDAQKALPERLHPALRELALLVDERYNTSFHSSLV
jgi:hypothetical protein